MTEIMIAKEGLTAAKRAKEVQNIAKVNDVETGRHKSEMRKKLLDADIVTERRRILKEVPALRELTNQEQMRLKSIGMSDANIEKCKVDPNGVFHLECRNCILEGGRHPETGVQFVRRQIEINGVKIEGAFPQFPVKAEYVLPEALRTETQRKQFVYLNQQLAQEMRSDPELRSRFTQVQLEMIEDGKQPAGCTWHHNEELGRMQLVDTPLHAQTGHTGGDSIWCGREKGG